MQNMPRTEVIELTQATWVAPDWAWLGNSNEFSNFAQIRAEFGIDFHPNPNTNLTCPVIKGKIKTKRVI